MTRDGIGREGTRGTSREAGGKKMIDGIWRGMKRGAQRGDGRKMSGAMILKAPEEGMGDV